MYCWPKIKKEKKKKKKTEMSFCPIDCSKYDKVTGEICVYARTIFSYSEILGLCYGSNCYAMAAATLPRGYPNKDVLNS